MKHSQEQDGYSSDETHLENTQTRGRSPPRRVSEESQRDRSPSPSGSRHSQGSSRSPSRSRSPSPIAPEETQLAVQNHTMPPSIAQQLAAMKAQNEALQAQLNASNAQSALGSGQAKRNSSPTEQVEIAKQLKKARTSKHKGKNATPSVLAATKEKIKEAIEEKVFATIKFIKGDGSTKELCANIVVAAYGAGTMKKKQREDWYSSFGKLAGQELNRHRSTVSSNIKSAFHILWKESQDLGALATWEACLNRNIAMANVPQRDAFTFYYNSIMAKATGCNAIWSHEHRGYFTLTEGHPPNSTTPYVTPETEAYALLIINGNLVKWRCQFQVFDKFPNYTHKNLSKAPSDAAIAASDTIKEAMCRANNDLGDDDELPPNWATTMRCPFETAANTNQVGLLLSPLCP